MRGAAKVGWAAVRGGAVTIAACGSDPETKPPPEEICTPRAMPDERFVAALDPASPRVALAKAIADGYIRRHPSLEQTWVWGEGVAMFGMVDLYRLTGEPQLRAYYQAFIDRFVDNGYDFLIVASDRCPPALSALALYEETCEEPYRQVVTDTLTYLYDEALRTEDGGINHLGTQDIFGVSLWLDSLFMFGNVLIRWGELSGEARHLDEYHDQFSIFAGHLQDDSGWFTHAYDWPVSAQDPDVFWARGNAWVTAATYDYLRVRKARGESDPEVEAAVAAQVQAILDAQDPATGLWWTGVNRPGETYLETSASALFAVGLARGLREGFLGEEVRPAIEAAMAGIEAMVVDQGDGPVVTGISGPTTVGDFDHYASIEVVDDLHYGVGAVLLALVETSDL